MSAIADASVTIGCITAAVGLSETNLLLQHKASMKPIIGGMILGAFLLFIGMFSLDLSKTLAILVLIASALSNGAGVFGAVTKVTS